MNREELLACIAQYDGLVVRSGVRVTEDVSWRSPLRVREAAAGRRRGSNHAGVTTHALLQQAAGAVSAGGRGVWQQARLSVGRFRSQRSAMHTRHTHAGHACAIAGCWLSLQIIKAGTKLKIIGRAGAGVDNIDTVAATRR